MADNRHAVFKDIYLPRESIPGTMPEVPAGIYEPLDVLGGPPPPWAASEVEELDIDQRREMVYKQRMFDAEGQDSAYDNDLSTVRVPAPRGGWPHGADWATLTQGVE